MVQVESLHAYQHHQSHLVYKSTTTVANKESPLDSNAVFKAYKLGLSLLSLYGHLRKNKKNKQKKQKQKKKLSLQKCCP